MFRYRFLAVGAVGFLLASAASADPGDLDNDGSVTVNDARLALRIAAGFTKENATDAANGDVAGYSFGGAAYPDGYINILDAVRILRAANGLDDLGGGSNPPGDPTLLKKTDTITIANANAVRNYSLTQGFTLSGTLTRGGLPVTDGTVTFTPAGSPAITYDATLDYEGNYSVVLPAGTFSITADADVPTNGTANGYSVTVAVSPATVTVSADATKNLTEAALAAPGTVAGSITATNFTPQSVDVSGAGGSGSANFAGNAYSVRTAPGQATLSFTGQYKADTTITTTVDFVSPLTVTSNATTARNVTVAALALEQGTITPPAGLAPLYIGLATTATGVDSYSSTEYASFSGGTTTPLTSYKLAVPPGNYSTFIILNRTSATPNLYYTTPTTVPAGGGTKNFTLPAAPVTFTFSGTVTDNAGLALAGATVSAGQSAFPANGYAAFNSATADQLGQFTMRLPNGAYTVTITPPSS